MTMTREQVAALLDGIAHGDDTLQASMMTARGINAIEAAASDLARQLLAAMDRLADADMAQAALIERAVGELTDAEAEDACLSFRHDFGLLPALDRIALCREAKQWHEALSHRLRSLAPDAGVKDLASLRAERDDYADQVANLVPALNRDALEQRAAKDAAYLERNKLVALLAGIFPSGIKRTAIEGWSEDWHGCVYIDFPWGQASWHYHDSQADLFAHLRPYAGEWDGHTTEAKYAAITSASQQYGIIATSHSALRADNSRLAAELADARKQVEALRGAAKVLSQTMADMLIAGDVIRNISALGVDSLWGEVNAVRAALAAPAAEGTE